VEIELVEAVAAVRDELLEAARRNVGHDVAFTVGSVEIEFAIELREDTKVQGAVKAVVVSGSLAVGDVQAHSHRVKVTLTPHRGDGSDLLINAEGEVSPRRQG
jgi:hypothetical protein